MSIGILDHEYCQVGFLHIHIVSFKFCLTLTMHDQIERDTTMNFIDFEQC